MSALGGSEDFDENYREVLRDRIIVLCEEMNSTQLVRIWAKCLEISEE